MPALELFEKYGTLCNAFPLEIIIAATTGLTSLFILKSSNSSEAEESWSSCSLLMKQTQNDNLGMTLDVLLRCFVLLNCFLQVQKLKDFTSGYEKGLLGGTFVFGSALLIGFAQLLPLTCCRPFHELLPYVLLLIDCSKLHALLVLASHSQGENTSPSMSLGRLGPTWTLDTMVYVLVVSIGSQIANPVIQTRCALLALTLISSYLSFLFICLPTHCLLLQLQNPTPPVVHEPLPCDTDDYHPNPVNQRVKAIMCLGLAIIHTYRVLTRPASQVLYTLGTELVQRFEQCSGDSSQLGEQMPSWRMFNLDMFMILLVVCTCYMQSRSINRGDSSSSLKTTNITMEYGQQRGEPASVFNKVVPEKPKEPEESATCSKLSLKQQAGPAKDQVLSNVNFVIGDDKDSEDEYVEIQRRNQDQSVQTDLITPSPTLTGQSTRSLKECQEIFEIQGPHFLTDDEVFMLSKHKKNVLPAYKLEKLLESEERAVRIRRSLVSCELKDCESIDNIPYTHYDYRYVSGSCCENVIGYTPVPLGVAGPLLLDDIEYHVPLATTEGALVASTNRGCKALKAGGGVQSFADEVGMSRAPVVELTSTREAEEVKKWCQHNFQTLQQVFNETSRFSQLKELQVLQVSQYLHLRFVASTGDAMGMNMVSKGCEIALQHLKSLFPSMVVITLSGNCCTDKKPSAINWIKGRGYSVRCEAVVPQSVVEGVLKTTTEALVKVHLLKNLMGSALAGSIGGNNAQAANLLAAIYIATGQDPAQVVEGSQCMTWLEQCSENPQDLRISCEMHCIEVGTVGGGTILPPQAACLKMLGVHGSSPDRPGAHKEQLARIVCGTVLAGELSLMSALAAGHLVRSHLAHNRSQLNMASSSKKITSSDSCVMLKQVQPE